MSVKLTREEWDEVRDQLGEGIHCSFRKGCDHPSAGRIWDLIDKMPNKQWSACVDFVMEGVFGPRPKRRAAEKGTP